MSKEADQPPISMPRQAAVAGGRASVPAARSLPDPPLNGSIVGGRAMPSLIPVLEFEPASFATRSHQTPSGSGADDPEGWFRYWSESLADAGIRGLAPWKRGSWFVTLDQLRDPGLLRLLVTRHNPDLATAALDEIGSLSGGYVLSH